MQKSLLLLLGVLAVTFNFAQSGSGNASMGEMSSFKTANLTYNIDPFGAVDRDGTMKGMKYADISGSPFLVDEWRESIIYDAYYKIIGKVKIKYNTNSDQIHFLDLKEQELVADKNIIKRVAIIDPENKDKFSTILEKGFRDNNNKLQPPQFVEVLNEGNIQLLKQYFNHIVQKDSLFSTIKINKFSPFSIYYLKTANSIINISKLDYNSVINILPNKELIETYSKKKKKLKSEEDFIEFLNFYNQKG
jgi:hypothetical protein